MNNVVYSTYILYADIYTVNYSIQLEHDDVIEVLPIERRTVWRNNWQAYKQWCKAGACLAQDNAYTALLTKFLLKNEDKFPKKFYWRCGMKLIMS